MPTIKVSGKSIKIKLGAISALPSTQSKIIEPNKETQIITPDRGFYALSSVTVNPVSEEYFIPEGTLDINENGEHDVRAYEKVNVDVKTGYDISIEENTLIFGSGATVNGSEVIL